MKPTFLLISFGLMFAVVGAAPKQYRSIAWQVATSAFAAPPEVESAPIAEVTPWNTALITAAEQQIGETVNYDPAYVGLDFPNGDVPRDRGVCSDVVIRALRDAHKTDLQSLVNTDMKRAFSAYPKTWGLSRTDRNIDHRRVLNLRVFFERKGAALPVTDLAENYLPGDVVTWLVPGNLPHMGIVTHRPNSSGSRPLVVHNIGAGTRLEDMLFSYEITGHYRLEMITAW